MLEHLKKIEGLTLRKELVLIVDGMSPITNEITISINPVKKWINRTTFCKIIEYLSIYNKLN